MFTPLRSDSQPSPQWLFYVMGGVAFQALASGNLFTFTQGLINKVEFMSVHLHLKNKCRCSDLIMGGAFHWLRDIRVINGLDKGKSYSLRCSLK